MTAVWLRAVEMALDRGVRIYDNVSMERKRRRRQPRRFIVQAILSPEVYRWVQRRCDREGLSTSSWLRRLVMIERQMQDEGGLKHRYGTDR
jgi:hypothetical protein